MGSDELLTFADAQVFFFNFSGEVFKKYRHLLRKRGGGKGVPGPILTFTDGGGIKIVT